MKTLVLTKGKDTKNRHSDAQNRQVDTFSEKTQISGNNPQNLSTALRTLDGSMCPLEDSHMGDTKYPTSRVRARLGEAFVNKSNALNTASYKLTLNEQRLILAAIAKLDSRKVPVRPGYDQISRIRIYASEFAETFGVSRKDAYDSLRDASAHLYERSVQINDGKKKGRFRWILKEEYAEGEGYVEVSFTPDVSAHLTLLRRQFMGYQLKMVAKYRSVYTIRLYEQLVQHRRSGIFRITLEEFIERLGLPYTRWVHIKQRVIDPAITEIKSKSNVEVICNPTKAGRKIAMLEFTFELAAQAAFDFEEDQNDEETQIPGDAQETADET